MNDHFSLLRFGLLLRSDLWRSYRSVLVVSGTAALLALAVSLVDAYDGVVSGVFYQVFFVCALFAWGTIGTSVSFGDLHGRATNMALLLLPASALEKAVSRLLLYTVGLFVYLLALTTVLSWLFEGINTVVLGVSREIFSPFNGLSWSLLPHYLVTQSLFFLGAVWFRKVQFVKTVGAVTAIVFGLCVVAVGVTWLFGHGAWTSGMGIGGDFVATSQRPIQWLVGLAPWVYYFALPVFCWFVAWLRVTETQVSHGI